MGQRETFENDSIVKVGIVVRDIQAAADYYNRIFPLDEKAVVQYPASPASKREGAYCSYLGKSTSPSLNVCIVKMAPIYLEILSPADDEPSPWRDHLEKYGPSVCFLSFHIDGFEQHLDLMNRVGMPAKFIEEKMYERYAYFDTQEKLGVMIEAKEQREI